MRITLTTKHYSTISHINFSENFDLKRYFHQQWPFLFNNPTAHTTKFSRLCARPIPVHSFSCSCNCLTRYFPAVSSALSVPKRLRRLRRGLTVEYNVRHAVFQSSPHCLQIGFLRETAKLRSLFSALLIRQAARR